MRTLLLLCLAATISAGKSWAQLLPVGIAGEDLLRLSSLLDSERVTSFLLRPLRIAPVPPGDLSLRTACAVTCLTPLRLRVFHNSGFPVVANDGAVWQGRGLTAALDAGFTFRRRGLELAALPTLVWAQNRSFALRDVSQAGRTEYANPWHPRNRTGGWIDLPQRFGPDALARLDPGHSYAAVSWRALRVSAGTTNLWWGPGRHNAIIISNQAPGFPHVSLSTARPIDVGIGRLEVQWLWGRPRDSRWSDSIPTDSARFFTGMAWTLAPDLFPGLWIGAARVFHLYVPPGGLSLGDYALVFQGITKVSQADSSNPTGDDDRDQLAALFMRWAPPGSGFEAYAEWARNDHNWDLRDFLLEPEHSQAYTLGLQAVRRLDRGRVLRIGAELTHLERSATL
ncbi:MAG TPA: capsule assembly Wzi family protein, partial [Gemmatimonadaceae bacterium]|nr:capsule assembly Wzi family protein [Gemmatimonadaceae bacterium]